MIRRMYYIVVPTENEKGEDIKGYVILIDNQYTISDNKENLAIFTKENAESMMRDYDIQGILREY